MKASSTLLQAVHLLSARDKTDWITDFALKHSFSKGGYGQFTGPVDTLQAKVEIGLTNTYEVGVVRQSSSP